MGDQQPASATAQGAEWGWRAEMIERGRPEEFERVGDAEIGGEADFGERQMGAGEPEAEGKAGESERQAGGEAE